MLTLVIKLGKAFSKSCKQTIIFWFHKKCVEYISGRCKILVAEVLNVLILVSAGFHQSKRSKLSEFFNIKLPFLINCGVYFFSDG